MVEELSEEMEELEEEVSGRTILVREVLEVDRFVPLSSS